MLAALLATNPGLPDSHQSAPQQRGVNECRLAAERRRLMIDAPAECDDLPLICSAKWREPLGSPNHLPRRSKAISWPFQLTETAFFLKISLSEENPFSPIRGAALLLIEASGANRFAANHCEDAASLPAIQ